VRALPLDPITVREDIIEKDECGGHDRVVLSKYEAPANDNGLAAFDPYEAKDHEIAQTMMRWLDREYPGHLWATHADTRQGIVKFNIPILMGVNQWWVVNLRTHDIINGMRAGAGQILERYRLRRGRFQLAPFLEAREKHSALVMPGREVPE
jgi:hypothetical protein